jgi:GT2 family glycosyltransferase
VFGNRSPVDEPDDATDDLVVMDRGSKMTIFPHASVILVGYNSAKWLPRALGALTHQDYPASYEVLFVDNGSSDASVELVRRDFPGVRIIESPHNGGYAGGKNLGAERATGRVLAFINPDTCAESNWLTELVRPLVSDRSVGMTTSKIVRMDRPETINTCGNDISMSGITTCRAAGEPSETIDTDEDVPAVSGAACAIRRDLFLDLGGFDDQFFMYLEDTDLSWRVRMAGYRCRLAARSIVAHDYAFQLSASKTEQVERNRYLMLAKNLSARSLVALIPSFLAAEVATWGWALSHGPRYALAKLKAIGWMLAHPRLILALHAEVQSARRVSDAALLRDYRPGPAIDEVSSGAAGQIAQATLAPLFTLTAMLALALISVPASETPVDARVMAQDRSSTARSGS